MMRSSLPALLMLLACHSEAASVRLHEESIVAAPYFTLGDIATVEAGDETSARRLRELRIGHSPRAATALPLKRAEVRRALLRLRPELRGQLQMTGAVTAVVRRGPLQTIESARLQETAHNALRAALAERYSRFDVVPAAGEMRAVSMPHGRAQLSARLPTLVPAPRRATVWVDIHIDSRLYQAVPVPFEVRAYMPALVARRPLRLGERLKPGDLELRDADVAGHGLAVTEVDALRLRRALPAGAILTAAHVERAPVVARDQEVRVRLLVGAVAVETIAIAAKDGATGEVIRVRNAASNQTFAARVTGSGVVEALWR